MSIALYSPENAVFRDYAFYAALVGLKMFAVTIITGIYRKRYKIYLNPEDCNDKNKGKVGAHPEVDRVLRIHRNDLENIPWFWILGLLYVGTNPAPRIAATVFKIFTASRVVFTVGYLNSSHLFRGLGYGVGALTNLYLSFSVLMHYIN